MALVRTLQERHPARTNVHAEVEATFHVFDDEGETFPQIDTYGAPGRQFAGKVSQSIQLGREGRQALLALLQGIRD